MFSGEQAPKPSCSLSAPGTANVAGWQGPSPSCQYLSGSHLWLGMCKRKPRARTEEENPGGFVKRKEHVAGDFQGAEDPRKGPQLGLRTALLALPRV